MGGDVVTPKQAAAVDELQRKPIEQIQRETADCWAHRAWAARQLAVAAFQAGNNADAYRLNHDTTEYEHEAIEHAALCNDDSVIAAVRAIIAGA